MRRVIGLVALLIALLGAVAWIAGSNPGAGKMRCNGMAELCDRRVDHVTFAGTHNSMAAGKEGWYAPNQQNGITAQLRSGIRALLIDTHYWETDADVAAALRSQQGIASQFQAFLRSFNREPVAGPLLCHSFCALGYKPLTDGLSEIRAFLDTHRNEVLIVFVEDSIRPEDMEQAMQASGLLKYTYDYDRYALPPWPTLRALIERDQRLLMLAENDMRGSLRWFPSAWQLVEDTPFRYPTVDSFDCRKNRGALETSLLLMNHWVYSLITSEQNASAANRGDVIKRRAEQCLRDRGQLPNIIAVDFAEQGDLLRVVRDLNKRSR